MNQQEAPVLRLHHIGHAVPDIELATKSQIQRFGYKVLTAPVHDAHQTAIVQFLQLPANQIYLELVAPDSPRSKLSATVKKGGGLHHLCYSSIDLEGSIESLSASGMRLIADPAPGVAFAGRRICWLLGADRSLVELVEALSPLDPCVPGEASFQGRASELDR